MSKVDKLKILAISGSTRAHSSNLSLIKATADMGAGVFSVTIFERLTNIPHFNPDRDNNNPPRLSHSSGDD